MKIFDPKTAFGNVELIRLRKEGEALQQILDETWECGECDGEGYVEHECDCEHCDYEGDDCEAKCKDGRISKKESLATNTSK